jgi:DeoR family glycerol-3-phosphate regulon repressor
MGMNALDRRRFIIDKLNIYKNISIKDICNELSVSLPTIRNDFDILEQSGHIIRTFGGAILNEKNNKNNAQNNISDSLIPYEIRTSQNHEKKVRIGSIAAGLIKDSDIIFLDAGTTVFQILDGIAARKIEKLVVLTNSLQVCTYLMNMPNIIHYLIGGSVHSTSMATIGFRTIDEIKRNRVNKVFLGADGMNSDGFTVQDINESKTKQAMMEIAAVKYLLADSSKINNPTFIEVAKFEELDAVITENGIFNIDNENIENSINAINRQE